MEAAARDEGLAEETADEVGEQEATRQADLARLVRLAREFDDGGRTVGEFVADLQSRFASDGEGIWRFTSRQFFLDQLGDVSQHMSD